MPSLNDGIRFRRYCHYTLEKMLAGFFASGSNGKVYRNSGSDSKSSEGEFPVQYQFEVSVMQHYARYTVRLQCQACIYSIE